MTKIIKGILSLAVAAVIITPASVFAIDDENEGEGELNESVYTITYDFNGGATFEGKTTHTKRSVGVAPDLNYGSLVTCFDYVADLDECHSLDVLKGKELDHVTVNGEEHYLAPGDGYMLDSDTTIVYYWNDLEMDSYTVTDANGNSITFDEAEGHEYILEVNSFSFSMTDEELAAFDPPISREEYEAGKSAITDAVKDQGPVIAYFEIEVYEIPVCGEEGQPCMCEVEEVEVPCHDDVHQGPFEIKIKYTDNMAGFDAYKFVNVDMANDGLVTVGDVVELTLVDGYLVGTIPHLSGYALIGSDEPNAPNTGAFTSLREIISEDSILTIVLATAFISAGAFLIIHDLRRR